MNTYAQAHRGLVLILIAALLWGTVGVATKTIYTLADTTALSVGFLRLAIATPVLLLACGAPAVGTPFASRRVISRSCC